MMNMSTVDLINFFDKELAKTEAAEQTAVRRTLMNAQKQEDKRRLEEHMEASRELVAALEEENVETVEDMETLVAELEEDELPSIFTEKVELTKEERMEKCNILTGFTQMTNSLMRELIKNVGGDGYAIYSIILSHRNTKTGECFLSYEQIAYETEFSMSKVKRNMQKLLGAGYVQRINNPIPGVASEFEFPLENFEDKTITKQEAETDIALGVGSNISKSNVSIIREQLNAPVQEERVYTQEELDELDWILCNLGNLESRKRVS